jgi:hypothetical protein
MNSMACNGLRGEPIGGPRACKGRSTCMLGCMPATHERRPSRYPVAILQPFGESALPDTAANVAPYSDRRPDCKK